MNALSSDLKSSSKRPKVHDAQMVTKLPKRAKELVNELAAAQGKSESAIVRDALAEYFERRGYRA